MNRKLTLVLLLTLNIFFLLMSLDWFKNFNERKKNLDNLELVNNELINTINKKGLMKNCKDFKDKESITLINPNIFKEAHEVNSIDILIDSNNYYFCYSMKSKNKLNKTLYVLRYYNVNEKEDYLFLKKVENKKSCSDPIVLSENYSYCIKEDYIIHK